MRKLLLKVKQSTAWRVLCRAYTRWVEADGNEGAAAFAYYLLLSFLPLLILLVTAGSLFVHRDVATQAVVQWVQQYVPLTGEWLFLLFGFYFTSFNALYGALGGIVAFLMWIYLSSCACVLGICFCGAQTEVQR